MSDDGGPPPHASRATARQPSRVRNSLACVAEPAVAIASARLPSRSSRSLIASGWLAEPKLAEGERRLAERVGFEPTCRLPGKTLSRRPRYDHFGTSPGQVAGVPAHIVRA